MGRVRKDCPICLTKGLLRLPNHMKQVHNLTSTKKRELSLDMMRPQSALSWDPKENIDEKWWETQSLLPFEPSSSIMVSGPTGSGKSRWVYKLLQNSNGMYVRDAPKNIMYCYGIHQTLFDEMEQTLPNLTLHEGLPTQTEIEEFSGSDHGLIVLDDLQQHVIENKAMELLFTQGCHHRRLSVIFIVQNLYGQGKSARTIALNSWYLVLFKNIRGTSQIRHLNSQLFPHKGNILIQAYEDAVKEPYHYLVIDLSPQAEDNYRLRTKIFPGEDPIVYKSL